MRLTSSQSSPTPVIVKLTPSMVIDPWGEVLYEGGEGEEGYFIEIDPEKVQPIRDHLQVFRMRRPELYSGLSK